MGELDGEIRYDMQNSEEVGLESEKDRSGSDYIQNPEHKVELSENLDFPGEDVQMHQRPDPGPLWLHSACSCSSPLPSLGSVASDLASGAAVCWPHSLT